MDPDEEEPGELLERFRRQHNLVYTSDPPGLNVVEEDPEGDKFIEAAVAPEAAWIVTGDRSLREPEHPGFSMAHPPLFIS